MKPPSARAFRSDRYVPAADATKHTPGIWGRPLTRPGEPLARPLPPGHESPLYFYVPGLECHAWVASTLPTTGTGRRPEGRRVARFECPKALTAEWAIRRTAKPSEETRGARRDVRAPTST